MSRKSYIIIIFAVLFIVSIYLFDQYKKALNYDYAIKDICFDEIGIRETRGTLFVEVVNPSNISAVVTYTDLKMYINNVHISDLQTNENIIIPGNSKFRIPLNFHFEPHRIFSIKNIEALKGILNPDTVLIGFSGYLTIKKGPFSANIQIMLNEPYSYYI